MTLKATLTASLGIEQDLEHGVDLNSAASASISGVTSENLNGNIKHTRPVASAGAYYAVPKHWVNQGIFCLYDWALT